MVDAVDVDGIRREIRDVQRRFFAKLPPFVERGCASPKRRRDLWRRALHSLRDRRTRPRVDLRTERARDGRSAGPVERAGEEHRADEARSNVPCRRKPQHGSPFSIGPRLFDARLPPPRPRGRAGRSGGRLPTQRSPLSSLAAAETVFHAHEGANLPLFLTAKTMVFWGSRCRRNRRCTQFRDQAQDVSEQLARDGNLGIWKAT
jgi:hypothetical protein